ncbi:hypothetical protein [Croceicoccus gelatinilyticus]|uniref:hypothetical protein n=1 Tax=Croceicoccus gelatinilyticus TaxID=2835536 RepID=UPI001BCE6C63|nr:hypothetical protein [Croceicoccus gelatinilyticus]MBS7671408.1 hypothetical protein [Croceicoccus gelatinilyticus]
MTATSDETKALDMSVTISDEIHVPEGSEIQYGRDGNGIAIKLPDGKVIKPWITWELQEDETGDARDLTYDQMTELGCHSEQLEKDIVLES